jgi:transposase
MKLSGQAREILQEIARSGEDGREVRRAQGLLWLDKGESVAEVAQRLGVSRQMLYVLVERYKTRSQKQLPVAQRITDQLHTGRPGHKRSLVASELGVLLAQSPKEYGYRAQSWTLGMLQTQVRQRHRVEVSQDTVRRALYNLNYRCKRPRLVLARRAVGWRQAKGGSNKG